VSVEQVVRLTELGLLDGDEQAGYPDSDIRRIQLVLTLERAGLPLEGLGRLVRERHFPLGFIDQAGEPVFAPLSDVTFGELAERTSLPVETLLVLRDATGGVRATPDDAVREDELRVVPLLELQASLGFRPLAMERALRVYGDSLRRIAEAESDWWRSEFQDRCWRRVTPSETWRDEPARTRHACPRSWTRRSWRSSTPSSGTPGPATS
jgi:hypothetical protein